MPAYNRTTKNCMKQLCISKVAAMGKQNTVLEYCTDRSYIIYSFYNTANSRGHS